METAVLAILLGFTLGLKHAFEPDHVIAISTLLHGEQRLSKAVRTGLAWGAGHTTTLVLGVTILSLLPITFDEAHLSYFELPVAAMLILLGAWVLWDALFTIHGRYGQAHNKEIQLRPVLIRTGWQGYLVGLFHGMAGSGALLLLVASTLPGLAQALIYAVVFGVGSVVGMGLVSVVLVLPFTFSVRRPTVHWALITDSGILSLLFGISLARDILL